MNKILVTGGAGFIGSHVVEALLARGEEVIVVDNLSSGARRNLPNKVTLIERDICDNLTDLFGYNFDYVIHLAAQINVRQSVLDPYHDAQVNVLGSLNLLQQCVKNSVKKVIFVSTGGAIYGSNSKRPTPETEPACPCSPYGLSKLTVEKYLELYKEYYKLPYTILRLANVFGPRQNPLGEAGVVSIFINRLLKDENCLIFGDGEQTRDFVYVGDVVRAVLLSLDKPETIGIFNVSTGEETSINKIYDLLQQLLSVNLPAQHVEPKVGELWHSCLDSAKIKQNLNWQAQVNLIDGLKKTVDYYQNLR